MLAVAPTVDRVVFATARGQRSCAAAAPCVLIHPAVGCDLALMNAVSAISGHFTKSFVLGTLLPTLVHVMFFAAVVLPIVPGVSLPGGQVNSFEALAAIVPVTIAVLIVSGILFNLNIPIIRLYEGYPWASSWIGQLRTAHYRDKLVNLQQADMALQNLLWLRTISESRKEDVRNHRMGIRQRLQFEFPNRSDLILPTRLGNVIRAFEFYPSVHYGIDGITLWPRLVAKIDKEYAALISDAKTSLDFMLNCTVLSTLIVAALLSTGLIYPTVRYSWQTALVWCLELAAFAVAARLFYIGAIGRAGAWGDVVKSAFDLYRLDLLKQLGYGHMPTSSSEERPLWEDISNRMLYGLLDSSERRYAPASTHALGEKPYTEDLQLTRGVEVISGDLIRIVVEARNESGQPRSHRL